MGPSELHLAPRQPHVHPHDDRNARRARPVLPDPLDGIQRGRGGRGDHHPAGPHGPHGCRRRRLGRASVGSAPAPPPALSPPPPPLAAGAAGDAGLGPRVALAVTLAFYALGAWTLRRVDTRSFEIQMAERRRPVAIVPEASVEA